MITNKTITDNMPELMALNQYKKARTAVNRSGHALSKQAIEAALAYANAIYKQMAGAIVYVCVPEKDLFLFSVIDAYYQKCGVVHSVTFVTAAVSGELDLAECVAKDVADLAFNLAKVMP